MTENPIPQNLTPQQVQAAQMLAEGRSTSYITRELKISDTTLYRWKKKQAFKELINSILAAELAETRFRMAHLADASVSALWDLVASARDARTRLQAVLHALKLTGVTNIPSPNVTQGVEFMIKPKENDDDSETVILTNSEAESRIEELPGQ